MSCRISGYGCCIRTIRLLWKIIHCNNTSTALWIRKLSHLSKYGLEVKKTHRKCECALVLSVVKLIWRSHVLMIMVFSLLNFRTSHKIYLKHLDIYALGYYYVVYICIILPGCTVLWHICTKFIIRKTNRSNKKCGMYCI